jgi:hypothetical protein
MAYIRLEGLQEASNTSIRKASVPAKSRALALHLGQPVRSDHVYVLSYSHQTKLFQLAKEILS